MPGYLYSPKTREYPKHLFDLRRLVDASAHCVQVARGRNGIPHIYFFMFPGVTSFLRAVCRGGRFFFSRKVVPGDAKEVGWTSSNIYL